MGIEKSDATPWGEVMEEKPKYDTNTAKREYAALRKYALLQKAAEEKIGCQKMYVDIAGGIHEAFVLDELIYFTLPRVDTGKSGLRVRKDGFLWMAVSRKEWWERKRLTPKEADGAIERLLKRGLVFKDYFLFNKQKTTHLRLNTKEFFRLYTELLQAENKPELEADDILPDLQDLYEMMGIPVGDTPKGIPNGDTGILKGNKVSLKGDSINSPNTTPTQPLNISPDFAKNMTIHEAYKLPTLRLYRDATGFFPGQPTWEYVHNFIVEHKITCKNLKMVFTEWKIRGFKSSNVKGILEWARDGIPEINQNKQKRRQPLSRQQFPDNSNVPSLEERIRIASQLTEIK